MTKKEYIDENFDIKELRKIGFLKNEKTTEEIEKRICTFFSLKNIFMYSFIGVEKTHTVKADIKTFSEN